MKVIAEQDDAHIKQYRKNTINWIRFVENDNHSEKEY